jgi:flavin-dependent dehydrogenase
VGDAALAVDPVSGTGVIRALETARSAVATILDILSARDEALTAYESARDAECTDYLVERAHYYDLERRWQSPFWQRRAGLASIDSGPAVREIDPLAAATA